MTLPSLRILLNRLPGASRVGAWLGERRFRAWKKRNPGRDFSHFYVDDVLARLRKGKGHPTLGRRGFLRQRAGTVTWTSESFSERGAAQWAYYSKVTGAGPGKTCVDFGCGSLRIGQHAFRDLQAGHYWGLDVTDAFINEGLALIDPALIVDKQPRFSIINDATLDDVRAWRPDCIFANAVVQHVPLGELKPFFGRIARIMAPGTIAAMVFIPGSSVRRVKATSWAYPDEVLTCAIAEVDRELEAECLAIEGDDASAFHQGRRLLRIRRAA